MAGVRSQHGALLKKFPFRLIHGSGKIAQITRNFVFNDLTRTRTRGVFCTYQLIMLFGRPLAHDAAISALSLCFENEVHSAKSVVHKSCICRGLRKPALQGVLQTKPLLRIVQPQLPLGGATFRKGDVAFQKDWTDGSAGTVHTQASPREPASSRGLSVKRPLQKPLEQAIKDGNWRETVALVEKLLLIGSVPDNIASDHLLKGTL